MGTKRNLNPGERKVNEDRKSLDNRLTIDYIRRQIESGSGHSITQLAEQFAEEDLYLECLRYVTVTNKCLCLAVDIPVANGTRYKRFWQKASKLYEAGEIYDPLSGCKAMALTTDPAQEPFSIISGSNQNQPAR